MTTLKDEIDYKIRVFGGMFDVDSPDADALVDIAVNDLICVIQREKAEAWDEGYNDGMKA